MDNFQVNEKVYDEIIDAVRTIRKEKPEYNSKQIINRINMLGIKNVQIRITPAEIKEYILLGIKRGSIEEIKPPTLEEKRKNLINELKTQISEDKAKEKIQQKNEETKKTHAFFTREK